MSRLDSAIRRLQAQRDCLDAAAARLGALPGCVLELGLGNGRTYDHLRSLCPGREVHAFDRQVAAHPDCVPPAPLLHLGELDDTLPRLARRIGRSAALAHMDLGSGDAQASRAQSQRLAALVAPLLVDGAIVLSDQPIERADWRALELPRGVARERYFMYRAGAG